MQPNNRPRLPTYAEATKMRGNHSSRDYSTPKYTNPISTYETSELPNCSRRPSVLKCQYVNSQFLTSPPAAQRIHIVSEIVPQSRSIICTRRQAIFWGIMVGLLVFAGTLRILLSYQHRGSELIN